MPATPWGFRDILPEEALVREAVADYKNKEEWSKLMYRAATTDFSWNQSAKQYEALYYDMLKY